MTLRAAWSVVTRPTLWATCAIQVLRLAQRGWWRRAPFLPLMDPEYLRFRLETAYGAGGERIEPEDLVAYLRWCKGLRGLANVGP